MRRRSTGRSTREPRAPLPYVPTGAPDVDLEPDDEDDADAIPKCAVVVDPSFDWEGDVRLETPWAETIIYELHVKGFTQAHPGVPEHLRGTYAGLASDAAIEHLTSLGVTAVELMPIHHVAECKYDAVVSDGLMAIGALPSVARSAFNVAMKSVSTEACACGTN